MCVCVCVADYIVLNGVHLFRSFLVGELQMLVGNIYFWRIQLYTIFLVIFYLRQNITTGVVPRLQNIMVVVQALLICSFNIISACRTIYIIISLACYLLKYVMFLFCIVLNRIYKQQLCV